MNKKSIKKKTFLLPQNLITAMKRTFKAKTETEALVKAMEEIAFCSQVEKWHAQAGGRMKIRNLYGS